MVRIARTGTPVRGNADARFVLWFQAGSAYVDLMDFGTPTYPHRRVQGWAFIPAIRRQRRAYKARRNERMARNGS